MSATGTWYLQDTVIITEHRMLLRGAAFYTDRYVRTDGGWQIADDRLHAQLRIGREARRELAADGQPVRRRGARQ